jgi:galactokinase
VRGAVAELSAAGIAVPATGLTISSTVPSGAGLSSSAALTVALTLALGGGELDRVALAKLCSRVENDWVGANTGLLDQLASLFGRAGHALRIDFRSLDVEPVPLDLGDLRLVTVDSGERHDLAASGYNARRAECERAAERLGIATLRDATLEAAAGLPEPLNRRVRHVVTENARVDETVAALRAGDLGAIGPLLDASHASLRDDYDASTDAVERTVAALEAAGALGARMMGGGFGGNVLALLGAGAPLPDGAREVRPAAGARIV